MKQIDTTQAVSEYLNERKLAGSARVGLGLGIETDPDQEAEYRRLAKEAGIPVDSVRSYPKEAERSVRLKSMDFDELARNFPSTAAYYSNPDNASIAHDEVGLLTGIEQAFKRGLTGTLRGGDAEMMRESFEILNLMDRIERGELKSDADIAKASPYASLFAGSARSPEAMRAYREQLEARIAANAAEFAERSGKLQRVAPQGEYARFQKAEGFGDALSALGDAPVSITAQVTSESLGGLMPSLPLVVGGGAGFGVKGLAAATGMSSATTEYLNSLPEIFQKLGVDMNDPKAVRAAVSSPELRQLQNQALVKAGVIGAVDAATAGVSGVRLARKAGANLAAQTGVQMAGGGVGEVAGSAASGQEVSASAVISEVIGEGPTAISDSAILAARNAVQKRAQAKQAQQSAEAVQRIADIAQQSKLRSRDPEAFKQFVQKAAEESGTGEVFIDARTFANTLAQSGVDVGKVAEQIPAVGEQLADAMAAGRDIALPVGDIATHLTHQAQALLPHLRTAPDALTQAEAQVYLAEEGPRIDAETEAAMAEAQRSDTRRESVEAIRDEFTQELQSAGRFSADVNKAYATLLANFYATQAERVGMSPTDFKQRYRLEVSGENVPGMLSLDQSPVDSPAFQEWFAGSQVVDPEGRPMVVYHGTAGDIAAFDPERAQAAEVGDYGAGFYFTPDTALASGYAQKRGDGANVLPVYVSLRNPYIVNLDSSKSQDQQWQPLRDREAAQAFTNRLRAEGYDGVIVKTQDTDEAGSVVDEFVEEVVAFSPEQVKSVNNRGAFDSKDRNLLNQGDRANRASLAFADDVTSRPSVISLLKNADLSSFIHEAGHFFLEVQSDLARKIQTQISAGAAVSDSERQVVADMDALLGWMGIKPTEGLSALDVWSLMTLNERRESHEQFARGFERYAFEGQAPSLQLQSLFQRFRSWLITVYRSLRDLNVELTDEVRDVMGRMLATDTAVREAETVRQMSATFPNAEAAGMTAAEYAAYQGQGDQATAEAVRQVEARSLKDMQWLSRARDRAIKAMQKDHDSLRKEVQREVRAEVLSEPVYRAWQFLTGKVDQVAPGTQAEIDTSTQSARLRTGVLKEIFGAGENAIWRKLSARRMTSEDSGMHPDILAELFGFESGEALVRALVDTTPPAEEIAARTDRRMLERYGDITSPEALSRAADEAVHNEARAKFIATELKALQRAMNVREADERKAMYAAGTVDVLAKAAKDYAGRLVSRLRVRDIRPALYAAAEARNARQAEQAMAKADTSEAALHKRNQLVNNYATKVAYEALQELREMRRGFERIINGRDKEMAKTRNMDLVWTARAILAAYDIGRADKSPGEYMEAIRQYDPGLYADMAPVIDGATAGAGPMEQMTLERMRAVRDVVGMLWETSRRSKQVEIDGQLVDRDMAAEALAGRLEDIGIAADQPGNTRAPTDGERRLRKFWGMVAATRRVESWASSLDGQPSGPFRKYIWQPISEAADRYRAQKRHYVEQFLALVRPIEKDLTQRRIAAPELNYTFSGMAELLHAVLHTGNDSNFKKLLVGRQWGGLDAEGNLDSRQWDRFIARMQTEGVLQKRHYDFAQGVWDLLESTKPQAQRAHRAIYGRYFDEITARPVTTPFGQYGGGYVPALTDAFLVQDAALHAEAAILEGSDANMLPAPASGFTKNRIENYNRQLALDLRLLPQHIDKVLKFSHMAVPVRDVLRIVKERGFSRRLEAFDPVAVPELLLPWLNRAAKQIVETPVTGDAARAFQGFWRVVRQRVGANIMFANVTNALQQITGLSLSALKVKPTYLARALWQYTRAPDELAEAVRGASTFMEGRTNSSISEVMYTIDELLTNPSKYEKVRDFAQRHAYFLQSAFQNVVDISTWKAAHDQALAEGATEQEAIRLADSAVRETQGSLAPEDISRFESGTAFVRLFTQFQSFFNMQANLLSTEFLKIARGMGIRKGAGMLLYVYVFGFMIPAIVADAIVKTARGEWDDEDEDGYLDEVLAWFFGSQARMATAMIPAAGPMLTTLANTFNDKPYDDRISSSPAIAQIETTLRAPRSIQKAIEGGDKSRAVRDTLTAVGLTGIPTGALARPAGYLTDVMEGDVEPTGTMDFIRGLVAGAASEDSKR